MCKRLKGLCLWCFILVRTHKKLDHIWLWYSVISCCTVKSTFSLVSWNMFYPVIAKMNTLNIEVDHYISSSLYHWNIFLSVWANVLLKHHYRTEMVTYPKGVNWQYLCFVLRCRSFFKSVTSELHIGSSCLKEFVIINMRLIYCEAYTH